MWGKMLVRELGEDGGVVPLAGVVEAAKTVQVRELLATVRVALGLEANPSKLLKDLAAFAAPEGGASTPSRQTIVRSDNTNRECGFVFANLMLEFLQTRRSALRNEEAFLNAEAMCQTVIVSTDIKRRHEIAVGSDPRGAGRIEKMMGVYALVRRDTGDHRLRQELLVLTRKNLGGDGGTLATYISPECVCRGTWGVIGNTLYCRMHGYRPGYKLDLVHVELALDDRDTGLLAGVISGIGSLVSMPTVMLFVGIRIATSVAKHSSTSWEASDPILRAKFSAIEWSMDKHELSSLVADALQHTFHAEGGIIDPTTMTAKLRRLIASPEACILPSLSKFVENCD